MPAFIHYTDFREVNVRAGAGLLRLAREDCPLLGSWNSSASVDNTYTFSPAPDAIIPTNPGKLIADFREIYADLRVVVVTSAIGPATGPVIDALCHIFNDGCVPLNPDERLQNAAYASLVTAAQRVDLLKFPRSYFS